MMTGINLPKARHEWTVKSRERGQDVDRSGEVSEV